MDRIIVKGMLRLQHHMGTAPSKYLSTEVAGGFTGVMIALYAQGDGIDCTRPAEFSNFSSKYIQ